MQSATLTWKHLAFSFKIPVILIVLYHAYPWFFHLVTPYIKDIRSSPLLALCDSSASSP